MFARTFTLVAAALLVVSLSGCGTIAEIVGSAPIVGCDNTLQIKVWHSGNTVVDAYVEFAEVGVAYYTDGRGLTPAVCCGSNTLITVTIKYGGLTPTVQRVGLHVGDNYVDIGF